MVYASPPPPNYKPRRKIKKTRARASATTTLVLTVLVANMRERLYYSKTKSPKSNPQLEDGIPRGFTAIPNDLLEHLAQLYLRPNDWQVLLSIIRKTLGWHKETDFITNSQIMEATGLCKAVVSRSLPKLQKRNIIIRRKRQIGVQQDWTPWTLSEKQIRRKLAKQQTPDTKLANQQTSQELAIPSTQLATQSTRVSYPRDTQKKTETNQKKVVDLIVNGRKERLDGLVNIHTVDHGIWQIDKELGKKLCLIELKIPHRNIIFNFPPSNNFHEALLTKMLESKYQNDNYEYTHPVRGPHRPHQLEIKIQRLLKILKKWAGNGVQLRF